MLKSKWDKLLEYHPSIIDSDTLLQRKRDFLIAKFIFGLDDIQKHKLTCKLILQYLVYKMSFLNLKVLMASISSPGTITSHKITTLMKQ